MFSLQTLGSSVISNTNRPYYKQKVQTRSCRAERSALPLELPPAPFPSPLSMTFVSFNI